MIIYLFNIQCFWPNYKYDILRIEHHCSIQYKSSTSIQMSILYYDICTRGFKLGIKQLLTAKHDNHVVQIKVIQKTPCYMNLWHTYHLITMSGWHVKYIGTNMHLYCSLYQTNLICNRACHHLKQAKVAAQRFYHQSSRQVNKC